MFAHDLYWTQLLSLPRTSLALISSSFYIFVPGMHSAKWFPFYSILHFTSIAKVECPAQLCCDAAVVSTWDQPRVVLYNSVMSRDATKQSSTKIPRRHEESCLTALGCLFGA